MQQRKAGLPEGVPAEKTMTAPWIQSHAASPFLSGPAPCLACQSSYTLHDVTGLAVDSANGHPDLLKVSIADAELGMNLNVSCQIGGSWHTHL